MCTAYWYLKAIKQYLDTTEETQPGLTTALKVCIGIFTLNLAVHLIAGDAFIFDKEGADDANLVLRSLGNPFSPNLMTVISLGVLGGLGLAITISLIRRALRRRPSDTWLIFGISLNLIFVLLEGITFTIQWEYAFSLSRLILWRCFG